MQFLNIVLPLFLALAFVMLFAGYLLYIFSGFKPFNEKWGLYFMIWGVIIFAFVLLSSIFFL